VVRTVGKPWVARSAQLPDIRGRLLLTELLTPDEALRAAILARSDTQALRRPRETRAVKRSGQSGARRRRRLDYPTGDRTCARSARAGLTHHGVPRLAWELIACSASDGFRTGPASSSGASIGSNSPTAPGPDSHGLPTKRCTGTASAVRRNSDAPVTRPIDPGPMSGYGWGRALSASPCGIRLRRLLGRGTKPDRPRRGKCELGLA